MSSRRLNVNSVNQLETQTCRNLTVSICCAVVVAQNPYSGFELGDCIFENERRIFVKRRDVKAVYNT